MKNKKRIIKRIKKNNKIINSEEFTIKE